METNLGFDKTSTEDIVKIREESENASLAD